MRISTSQMFTTASRNMAENQTALADIQGKLASGKKFTSLAENPVGASQVVSLKRELSQLDMYQSNIDASRRRLELEETTLDDLNTAMDRMRELTLQASNGTLSDSDRLAISAELQELVNYSAGLMNTRDAKGEYLFSGSKGNTQAYALNGNRYEYQGDSAGRTIQVASGQYVRSTDSGEYLFESIEGEPAASSYGLAAGRIDAEITDAQAYTALMRSTGDIQLSFTDDGAGTFTYTLTDSAGNTLQDSGGNPVSISYDPTDVGLVNPASVALDGVTLSISLPTDSTTLAAEPTAGLRFEQPADNILNTMLDTIDALKGLSSTNPQTRAELSERMAKTLTQIGTAQERVNEATANIGSRLNSLDNAEFSNTDFKLMTQGTLSAVEDLDYAAAATELAKRQLALEAAYASFSKIQDLSLFNYIR